MILLPPALGKKGSLLNPHYTQEKGKSQFRLKTHTWKRRLAWLIFLTGQEKETKQAGKG